MRFETILNTKSGMTKINAKSLSTQSMNRDSDLETGTFSVKNKKGRCDNQVYFIISVSGCLVVISHF